MTDYDIFNWLYAYVVCIERIHHGFALTYNDSNGVEQVVLGDDIKACVRKVNNV